MSDSDSSAGDSSADSSSERSANSTFSGNDDDDDNDSTVGSVSGSQQSGASSGGSHAKAEAGAKTETGTNSKAAATVKPFAIPKHRVCTKVARYPVVFKTFKHYKWKRVPREEGQWSLHWADKVLLCMSTPNRSSNGQLRKACLIALRAAYVQGPPSTEMLQGLAPHQKANHIPGTLQVHSCVLL